MKRKVALTAAIVSLLLVSMATEMPVANADPVFVNKYPVTVALTSQKGNATFAKGFFRVNFSLADVPRDKITYHASIVFTASALVDENFSARTDVHFDLSRSFTPQEYSIELTNVTEGTHTLRVVAVYSESDSIGKHFTEVSGSSETIHFSVGTAGQNPELSALPSSSNAPNPTQQQTPNSWSTMAPMPSAWQSAQTAVVNGKIYVIGDYLDNRKGSYSLINYEYDPVGNSWQTKTPTPLSRYGSSLIVYQDKTYLVGGFTGGGINPPATLVYNPATDAWTEKASMPTTRIDVYVAIVDGKIYVIGGHTTNPWAPGPPFVENEVYDIANDSWSEMAPIPIGVDSGFSTVFDGKIYIFGETRQARLIVQVFDPKTNQWSQGTNPQTSVERFASAVIDNKVFVIGGTDNYTYPNKIFNLVQVYDPKTDRWSQGAPMQVGVFDASTGLTTEVLAPRRIYLFGGYNDTQFSRTTATQVYNPENDSWSMGAPMTFTRWSFAVANVNDSLYVFGGVNYTTVDIAVNEKYAPVGYGAIPSPSIASNASQVPSLSPSPSVPEFSLWGIVVFAVAVSALLVALRAKKAGARNHGII